MSSRIRSVVLAALFVAACGVVVAYIVKANLGEPPLAEETVEVYVATQDVPEYTLLRNRERFEKYFKKLSKPKSQVCGDAILANDPDFDKRVYGRRLKTWLKAGDYLAESHLGQGEDVVTGFTGGETAYTLKANLDYLSEPFLPRDRVDVWAIVNRPTNREPPYAELLLEDIEVLGTEPSAKEFKAGQVMRIYLRLQRDDVSKIAPHAENGTLRFANRLPSQKRPKTDPAKLSPGEMAFTIKGNPDHPVIGSISPGDRVDIWAVVTRPPMGEAPYIELILEDVEVLAINMQLEKIDGEPPAERITLRLLPDQVRKVAAFSESGTLRLVKHGKNLGRISLPR